MSRASFKNIHNLIKSSTNKLSVEQAFLNDLLATIEKTQNQRPPSKSYKPSSGLKCLRDMYYTVTGAPTDEERMDAGLIGICESGTSRHEKLQDYIIKMEELGIDCGWIDVEEWIDINNIKDLKVVKRDGNEVKCYNETYNLSFMCDGIIEYKDTYFIIEIKTEASFKWQNRTEAADEHITQACCYALCFDIREIIFIYENRDTCQKKPYRVMVTDEMINERVVEKIAECENYVQRLIPPPRTSNKRDCGYCKYKKVCSKDG